LLPAVLPLDIDKRDAALIANRIILHLQIYRVCSVPAGRIMIANAGLFVGRADDALAARMLLVGARRRRDDLHLLKSNLF